MNETISVSMGDLRKVADTTIDIENLHNLVIAALPPMGSVTDMHVDTLLKSPPMHVLLNFSGEPSDALSKLTDVTGNKDKNRVPVTWLADFTTNLYGLDELYGVSVAKLYDKLVLSATVPDATLSLKQIAIYEEDIVETLKLCPWVIGIHVLKLAFLSGMVQKHNHVAREQMAKPKT